MGIRRPFLMVGGPLHATVQQVEMTTPAAPVDVVTTPVDAIELYPLVWTNLATASNYTRRTVAHVANLTGEAYKVHVYVHESIENAEQGQMLLGDAVMHRYFIEHGERIPEADRPTPPVNGKRSGLILPGQG